MKISNLRRWIAATLLGMVVAVECSGQAKSPVQTTTQADQKDLSITVYRSGSA